MKSEYEHGYQQGYIDACKDMLKRLDNMRQTTVACAKEVETSFTGVEQKAEERVARAEMKREYLREDR